MILSSALLRVASRRQPQGDDDVLTDCILAGHLWLPIATSSIESQRPYPTSVPFRSVHIALIYSMALSQLSPSLRRFLLYYPPISHSVCHISASGRLSICLSYTACRCLCVISSLCGHKAVVVIDFTGSLFPSAEPYKLLTLLPLESLLYHCYCFINGVCSRSRYTMYIFFIFYISFI